MLGKFVKFERAGEMFYGYVIGEDRIDYCVLKEDNHGMPFDFVIRDTKAWWRREIETGSVVIKEPVSIPYKKCRVYWVKKSFVKPSIQNVE